MRRALPHRQKGAVLLTVCLLLFFLLGFMGVALDFGRAFVVRTELQTAMDSCALSAAQELDGAEDAITRATSSGLTASNVNRVQFQSTNWDGKGQLTSAGITFRDSSYNETTTPASAKYAQCAHTQRDMQSWLLSAFGDGFPNSLDIGARAVATRASAQSTCPVPLALKPKAGGTAANNYGFVLGEWVTLIMSPGGATGGEIGWANLDGSNDAAETVKEMNGHCGTKVGDTLGTPGVQATVADNWNFRFGIYKNSGDPSVAIQRPDYTGYAYTLKNWPTPLKTADGNPIGHAFDGAGYAGSPPIPPGAHATAAPFTTKRLAFASCADTGTQVNGGPGSCEGITGLTLNSFQKLAAPGPIPGAGGHWDYGMSRRLVVVPVVNASNAVTDYACMLMLQPLSVPLTSVQLEYRGLASAPTSPCTTSGLPGGNAGPLVPVLVR